MKPSLAAFVSFLALWPLNSHAVLVGYSITITTAYATTNPFPNRLDPAFTEPDTGYFQVVFPGPGDDMKRLRVPAGQAGETISPSVQEQLNNRQKKMAAMLIRGEELTSQKCEKLFAVTRDTANRDFILLIKLGLAQKIGAGRATRYQFHRAK